MKRSITAYWLGRVSYERAHALQERLVRARIQKEIGDVVLFLEHDPVITLGRGAKIENVRAGVDERRDRGVSFYETGRGGDVTFHGPGQLVCYPILDLKPDRCDVRKYVRDLAEVMVGLARDSGVAAGVLPGDPKYIGVWVNEYETSQWDEARMLQALGEGEFASGVRLRKIGAIGVRLSRWVTMHGFAFNAATDLASFGLIVPCGIDTLGVTSLRTLGKTPAPLPELAKLAQAHFARLFDAAVVEGSPEDLPVVEEVMASPAVG
jgi:lipoyl(octanoyl) transferase